jgi:hypothetical protein
MATQSPKSVAVPFAYADAANVRGSQNAEFSKYDLINESPKWW